MTYQLPEPDTHCFDEDTKTDCWSFSRDLLLQEIAKAELRGREARSVCLWNNVTYCCYCGGTVKKELK
jgi:hypothetical protein